MEHWSLVESSSNHRQGRVPRSLFSHSAGWSSNEVAIHYSRVGVFINLSAGAFTTRNHRVFRGVGTGPADPATAGPKFPVHQESPQLIFYINCKQARNQAIICNFEIYTKVVALLYIIDYYIENTRH